MFNPASATAQELRLGDVVTVRGGPKAIQGKAGTLLEYSRPSGTWSVAVHGKTYSLKPEACVLSKAIACTRLKPDAQTGFVKRYCEAMRLIELAAEATRSCPDVFFQRSSATSIELYIAHSGIVRACSLFIQAMTLTDARIEYLPKGPTEALTLGSFRLPVAPDLVFALTSDPPPEDR